MGITSTAAVNCKSWDWSGDEGLLQYFPDFFVIGPQRTGTTWLARELAKQKRVFMTPEKEPHFFCHLHREGEVGFRSRDLAWYLQMYVPAPPKSLREKISRLFVSDDHVCRGEATATYAVGVEESVIQDIVAVKPDLKVILMFRDPIQRAWSHAKKDLLNVDSWEDYFRKEGRRTYKKPEEVSDEKFLELMNSEYHVACGRMAGLYEKWNRYFPADQIFIGAFDDVHEQPANLLRRVMQFLTGSDAVQLDDEFKAVVSSTDKHGQERDIPQRFLAFLTDLFAGEREKAEAICGRPLTT